MAALYHIIKLKNYLKANFNEDNGLYRIFKKVYAKCIFPLEYRVFKKRSMYGFESKMTLHMCSLLPKKTLDAVINYYRPKTWIDVGCGTGSSLKYVKKRGIKVLGLENSVLAIKTSGIKSDIKMHDLTQPANYGYFDVVWCYEVAEHLPEYSVNTFISTLISNGKNIILSAATPGQGGDGHINEQPASYWIEKMNAKGFVLDKEITKTIHELNELYSINVHCFKKQNTNC